MIKAIVFDCFGVLTTDGWKQIRQEVIKTDAERQEAHDLDRAVNTGMMNYDDFVARVADLANLNIEETRKHLNSTAPNLRLLNYIRRELTPHYKIGLLSNAADNWLDDLLGSDNVALFDEIVLSYAVGMVKPQPAIYDLIATKLGVLPEECLFIDDIERYVTAAINVGMKGIVFNDTEQCMAECREIVK